MEGTLINASLEIRDDTNKEKPIVKTGYFSMVFKGDVNESHKEMFLKECEYIYDQYFKK
jgi:hypothetical protein